MLVMRDPRAPKSRNIRCCVAVFLSLCSYTAFSSTPQESNGALLREYNAAIAQKQPADRIRKLQQFAWTTSGPLRIDALEVVVWEYWRAGNNARALTWANELNLADKGNALAMAVICQDAQHSSQSGVKQDQLRRMANQGENALPRLRHPVGMSDADFVALRRQTSLMLEGATGQPTSQARNSSIPSGANSVAAPGTAVHSTPAVDPMTAQRMYRQAISDLNHKNSNHRQDFWELARAVVLSGGSIQGHPIAEDARKRYLKDGGTNAGWNQFLEAAAAGNPSLAPSARFASSRPAPLASPTPPPDVSQPASADRVLRR